MLFAVENGAKRKTAEERFRCKVEVSNIVFFGSTLGRNTSKVEASSFLGSTFARNIGQLYMFLILKSA